MKHIIFYIVVSILFVSVFSCKQRKNMQYLPFFYMKNYEVMHSKKYISIRENEYSDIDDTGFVWNLYNKNGEYYLKEYGKSMIFMTTKREIDTTFLIGVVKNELYQLNLMILYLYQLYIILPFMKQ